MTNTLFVVLKELPTLLKRKNGQLSNNWPFFIPLFLHLYKDTFFLALNVHHFPALHTTASLVKTALSLINSQKICILAACITGWYKKAKHPLFNALIINKITQQNQ